MIKSIGYDPEPPCECTPILSPGLTSLRLGETDTKFEQEVRIVGSTPRITGTPFKPAWLTIAMTQDGIKFSGTPPDTTKVSGIVQLKNECSAGVIISYSGQAIQKCINNPDVVRNLYSANALIQELIKVAADAVIVEPIILPTGMTATMFESGLSLSGTPVPSTVFPFEYRVELSARCGTFTVTGLVTTAEKPPDCILPAIIKHTGDPVFKEGVLNTYCMLYEGTKVRIEELPELPVGLVWDHRTPGRVCVTGALVKDICSKDSGESCVSLALRLVNACGTLKTFMSIQSVNSAPADKAVAGFKFCAGMVQFVPVPPSRAGLTRWSVTAHFFPVDSILTVSAISLNAAAFAMILPGDSKEIKITGDETVGFFEILTGTSGCSTTYIQATHPTCAIVSNIANLTAPFQAGNDCNAGGVGQP